MCRTALAAGIAGALIPGERRLGHRHDGCRRVAPVAGTWVIQQRNVMNINEWRLYSGKTEHAGRAERSDAAWARIAPELLGDSAAVRQLRQDIARVACLNLMVLIEGKRGTGKKLVARAIHEASRRRQGPFVEFACTNMDPLSAASAFFGHSRGTFGNASPARAGVFESAHRGTLLLHRIDELPLGVQAQLLRVVEEGMVRRVGGTYVRSVDVRLIATTSRDLSADAIEGRFREDLLYRICGVRIQVPALEARREDVPFLADAFRHQACLAYGRRVYTISLDAVEYLMRHEWPGNIAELKAAIESAVFRCTGSVLEPKDFPPDFPAPAP